MARRLLQPNLLWMAAGITIGAAVVGVFFGGMVVGRSASSNSWPFGPSLAHAVATDRYENFAIATGFLNNDLEAVYFLDFLTGDLKAAALSLQTGKFNSFYEYNVLRDLEVDATKNPRYLMVTGGVNLRRQGGQLEPSGSVVYVAELTSGKVAAYTTPFNRTTINSGKRYDGQLLLLDVQPFRTTAIRGG